jgi:DNA-binding CsgD family transcriptional regulator
MSIGGSLLLERDLETEALAEAVTAATQGAGRLVVIAGPGGIGKTRLLETSGGLAKQVGARVLAARGHELERDFPYGVVRQLYEPVLAGASESERERWLSGAAGLVPSLLSKAGADAAGEHEETFARLHGLYWLFANVAAERPVVVLVDDGQWADDTSLRFLGFLARRVRELRLTLVVATRPGQPGRQPLLRDLISDPAALKLQPAPLSAAAVAAWIAADLGEDTDAVFADACREVTNGYPFFVRELLYEIRTEEIPLRADAAARVRELGPEGVASVVLVRLSGLPPAAAALARALAALGDGANLRTAARLAALADDETDAAVDGLSSADVLEPGPPVRFVHPIIRAAILAEIPRPELSALHGTAAQLLRDDGAPLEQVAGHLLAAGGIEGSWAVETLRAAAADALARGGARTSVRYLERALAGTSGTERAPLLLELGRAQALAGEPDAAEHLREAIALAGDARVSAQASLTLARALKYARRANEACDVLEAALADPPSDQQLRDGLETELLSLSFLSLSARERLRPRLATLAEPEGPPTSSRDALALACLGARAIDACDPVERAVSLLHRALIPRRSSKERAHGDTIGIVAHALTVCDRFNEADALFAPAGDLTRKRGFLSAYLGILSLRSMLHYRRGALADAEADASEALALAGDLGDPQTLTVAAENARNLVALERGDPRELERLARAALTPVPADTPGTLLHSRGRLRAATGDLAGALTDLLAVGEQEQQWNSPNPAHTWWRSDAALILVQLGEHAQARRLAEEELEMAQQFGAPRALGIALRAVALTRGRTAAIKLLHEAAEVLRHSGAELEYARVLTDLGAAIRRAGQPAKARDPLRRGYELAGRCGAKVLAERAMHELLAAGARPRRTALSGVDSLTPSERRVAEFAADGMTNREIAQALFVTEKTVETHLGHVYPKLDITSRAELAAKLTSPRSRPDGPPSEIEIPSPSAPNALVK